MAELDLPRGWAIASYEDVYLSASNGTGGTQNKEKFGIPVSRIETIAEERIDYTRIGFLAEYDREKVERHKLVKGDILFSHINSPIHLGKTAIYDGKHDLYHGINLLRIVVNREVILPEIFNWHCKYTRTSGEFALRAQHAVNQSSLNQKKLGEFEIPLPPLAEQTVIAEKLDTLLAQVDNTKARLERIPEILKSFRQSVLAAAVSGRLTNSDTLNWITHTVDDLVKVVNGKAFPSEDYQEKGVRLLRPGNLHMSGAVIWNAKNTTFIPESWVIKRPELILRDGALLMNLTAQSLADEFLGRVCVFSEQKEITLLNQRICSFESKLDYDIKPYLFLVFKSPQFRSFVDTLDSGTLIKHLNVKDIKNYTLQLPKELEQTEIVRRVQELFAFADRIEQAAQAALSRVNNLTQSILAKAFRGELTADWRAANPDLISGDNSAEALLAKIKAERAKLSKKTKAKA